MSQSLCKCCISAGFFRGLCLVAVVANYLGNPLIPEVQVVARYQPSCHLSTGELVSTHLPQSSWETGLVGDICRSQHGTDPCCFPHLSSL